MASSRTSTKFEEACIDRGAQKCVIGCAQENDYCKERLQLKLGRSRIEFRFCDGSYRSLGSLPVRMPPPDRYLLSKRSM